MGKSSIPNDSAEYRMVQDAVRVVMPHDFGIIHGGYAGGAMSAASDAASGYIVEHGLSAERNIGVPQLQHEGLWDRVGSASFTEVADNLFTRLHVITSGDIAIFAPMGGDGTEVEESIVFHENVIRGYIGKKPVPMIFLQTPTGTRWKKLLEAKMDILATNIKDVHATGWIYFVDSIPEFENLLKEILERSSRP
jgi:predicted Rossmann-fold nucleotide-binding protein